MRTCVVVFGPPGSGKTSLVKGLQINDADSLRRVVPLCIGEYIRTSNPAALGSVLDSAAIAEQALDAAC